jgi:hypothetical protein
MGSEWPNGHISGMSKLSDLRSLMKEALTAEDPQGVFAARAKSGEHGAVVETAPAERDMVSGSKAFKASQSLYQDDQVSHS